MAALIKIDVYPLNARELALRFKYDPMLVEKIRNMPQRRWDKDAKVWAFPPTQENIEFINTWLPGVNWAQECDTFRQDAQERQAKRDDISRRKATGDIDVSVLSDVPFALPPKEHQKVALVLGRDLSAFAYLMDQGTGKTKVLLDDIAHNFRAGRINGAIIFAPNSVKTNWCDPDGGEDEIKKHMPPDIKFNAAAWMSNGNSEQNLMFSEWRKRSNKRGQLDILVANIEGVAFDRCFVECEKFCRAHKTFIAIDESTRIKHRTAQRTKAVMKLRKLCNIARIASGTPVIKSPLNAYSQFYFLDPEILGFHNYRTFEARYGVKGGYGGYEVLFYQNLDELQKKIDTASYRVLKDDCLDLEPKIYQKRYVNMTHKQESLYNTLREESIAEITAMLEDGTHSSSWIEANIVLTKYLRLQQITAGFAPVLDGAGEAISYAPLGSPPPKIEEALDIIEECQNKVIVWCRFIPELRMMADALKKSGIGFVEFHGGIAERDRIAARRAFQADDDTVKVFLGQIQTGGVGITLNKARTVIYLSNTFNTEDRVQSEDRAHRIGTVGSVTYIDIITKGTIDTKVIQCLRDNKRLSDMILKDGIREWI